MWRQIHFIPSLSFPRNQKQESNFQEVEGLVTKNITFFVYRESGAILHSRAEFNRPLQRNFIICYSCFFIES